MFIQEQMATLVEMNDEMQDVITDMTALASPITSVYTGAGRTEYLLQISQWYDLVACYLFV